MNRADADLIARRTLAHYQQAIDSMSRQKLAALFAEDAVLHRANAPIEGREAILEFYKPFFPVVGHMRHFLSSILAEPDGDLVRSECIFWYIHVRADEVVLGWGDYRHTIRPTGDGDGEIIEKHITVHHSQAVPMEVADALRPGSV